MDRRKLKKARKQAEKGKGTAEQLHAIYGCEALASVELTTPLGRPLHLDETQNLLLWALTHDLGEMPKWAMVRHKPLISGALVILARDLDAAGAARCLGKGFTAAQPLFLPRSHRARLADACASELLQVKVSRKRKVATQTATSSATTTTTTTTSRLDGDGSAGHVGRHASGDWRLDYVRTFAASVEELSENGYPLSTEPGTFVSIAREGGPSYVSLAEPTGANGGGDGDDSGGGDGDNGGGGGGGGGIGGSGGGGGGDGGGGGGGGAPPRASPSAHLIAIDCEMVLVRGSSPVDGGWPLVKQLARVALVDASGQTLMDELVIPQRPVADYKTEHSGMTPALLATATRTHDQVRAQVGAHIRRAGAGVVLVGHSLECDLHALRLSLSTGACVLDTSLLYPHKCHRHGPPSKAALRHLTVRHLGREIQQPHASPASAPTDGGRVGPSVGHSPTEDALAALDLAKLKLARGHGYGTPDRSWGSAFEPLPAALARSGWNTSLVADRADALLALPPPAPEGPANAAAGESAAEPPAPRPAVPTPTEAGGARSGATAADAPSAVRTAGTACEGAPPPATIFSRSEACADDATAARCALAALQSAAAAQALSGGSPSKAFVHVGLHALHTDSHPLEGLIDELPHNTLVCLVGINRDKWATGAAAATDRRDGAPPTASDALADDVAQALQPPVARASNDDQSQQHGGRTPPGWVAFAVTGPQSLA